MWSAAQVASNEQNSSKKIFFQKTVQIPLGICLWSSGHSMTNIQPKPSEMEDKAAVGWDITVTAQLITACQSRQSNTKL